MNFTLAFLWFKLNWHCKECLINLYRHSSFDYPFKYEWSNGHFKPYGFKLVSKFTDFKCLK